MGLGADLDAVVAVERVVDWTLDADASCGVSSEAVGEDIGDGDALL